jgi:hypothetical protein
MKRIAMVLALVAMGACQKQEQKPAAAMPSADTSHMMMADTSKGMMMADTSKHMMMADTSKKMAPAAKPAAKPAPKKKP